MSAIIDCPQVMSRGMVNVSGRTARVRDRARAALFSSAGLEDDPKCFGHPASFRSPGNTIGTPVPS